jgi:hypothetical protein
LPWPRSTATRLAAKEDGRPAAWIEPQTSDREPNPLYGYVVSFIRFHERGFAAPTSRFMRALCYHYGVELHNFTPNAISLVATFISVCEGFLGILVNWDLWVHLFHAELHTLATPEPKMLHPLHDDFQQHGVGAGWFYIHNDGDGLPLLRQGADGEG